MYTFLGCVKEKSDEFVFKGLLSTICEISEAYASQQARLLCADMLERKGPGKGRLGTVRGRANIVQ